MFATARKTFSLFLTASLFTGALQAQSLDGHVERNPDDTVTYTIDLDGPPRGQAVLFMSTALAPLPWPIFPLGQVYLDPHVIFQLTPIIPLDNFGRNQFQFQLPANLVENFPLTFQSVNIDQAGIIRLSMNAVALAQAAPPPPPAAPVPVVPFNYTFAYENGGENLRMAGTGTPGTVVEVRIINGDRTVTETTTVDADGKFFMEVEVEGGITSNDDVMVIHDGSMVDKVDLYKF